MNKNTRLWNPFRLRFSISPLRHLLWLFWIAGLLLTGAEGYAATYYVKANNSTNATPDGLSWATAFAEVFPATTNAAPGDQIWVAAGNYSKGFNISAGVAIYGGFAGNETNLNQRNWSANTTILPGCTSTYSETGDSTETRIDGFTITGGSRGYGIYCQSSSLIVANNRIVANKDSGIYCWGAYTMMITNNVIAGNGRTAPDKTMVVGGGICLDANTATVLNNVISGNTGLGGGGIMCYTSNALIAGNTIEGNQTLIDSAGIGCGSGTPRIMGNRIINNIVQQGPHGYYGGAGICIFGGACPLIANNMIMNNGSFGVTTNNYKDGGGIRCEAGSSANIINNTLISNRTDCAGGAIYLEGNQLILLANNLISGNSSGITGTTNTVFNHNCVYGNGTNDYENIPDPTGSDGNISLDPKLIIDADFSTAHILPDSPCRDAGDSSPVQTDWTDMDGQPRIQGTGVDIGAHESDGLTALFPAHVVRVSLEGDDANDGSTWDLGKHSIQAAIDTLRYQGGEVWVQAGAYQGCIQMDTLTHLYGGFAGNETNRIQRNPSRYETVLDAQRSGTVVTCRGAISWGGVLEGFTIQNGLATNGGGIFIDRCSPRIAHNHIRQNQAQYGGGIMIKGNASPEIIGNWIVSNLATRMPNASGTQFSHGGGVYQVTDILEKPYSVLINNLIADNRAVGDSVYSTSGGGIYYCGGNFVLINNTFLRNSCIQTISNSPSSIPDNATFVGCQATAAHPAALLENNILAFGGIEDGSITPIPIVIANNCFFANGTNDYSGPQTPMGTNGNFMADPLFIEINGLPVLQAGSPCIDTGDDSAIDPSEPDLAGNARLMGSHVDIGAIEYNPSVIQLSAPQWTAGMGLRFKLSGPQEKEFIIQTSTDFKKWEPVMTNHCGTVLITNSPSGQMDQCYFRAVIH